MAQVAVIAPQPAHPGDNVTVIWKHHVSAPAGARLVFVFHNSLYGPFPSRDALQAAVEASTIGPPTWRDVLGDVPAYKVTGGLSPSSEDIFDLPRQLVPGLYDLVVSATIQDINQTSRADWPLIVARVGG